MTYILFGLGVLFILLGFIDVFPKVKQNYVDLEEMQRWQKQKVEVVQAKEDLEYLLEELKNVSDQTVKSIETKIYEAKNLNMPVRTSENSDNQTKQISKAVSKTVSKSSFDILINDVKINPQSDMASEVNQASQLKAAKQVNKKKIIKEGKEEQSNHKMNTEALDKHTYIYQLSKQGFTVDEIAQKVQMGKGEVELIIGIKRRGEQA